MTAQDKRVRLEWLDKKADNENVRSDVIAHVENPI